MSTFGCFSLKVLIRSSFQPVPGPRKVSHFILTVSVVALPLCAPPAWGAACGAQAASRPTDATAPLICKKRRRDRFFDMTIHLLGKFFWEFRKRVLTSTGEAAAFVLD